jgi:hypothetical protein
MSSGGTPPVPPEARPMAKSAIVSGAQVGESKTGETNECWVS